MNSPDGLDSLVFEKRFLCSLQVMWKSESTDTDPGPRGRPCQNETWKRCSLLSTKLKSKHYKGLLPSDSMHGDGTQQSTAWHTPGHETEDSSEPARKLWPCQALNKAPRRPQATAPPSLLFGNCMQSGYKSWSAFRAGLTFIIIIQLVG